MKIEVTKIVVHAPPNANIVSCMKDAIELAVKEWRNVELQHNSKSYMVSINDLLSSIKERC